MKQTIKNYSFNASSHTITFSDFSSIILERVYLITDVTSNTLIYQFNNPALGGSVSTNVLTLTYNTGSLSNSDKLQIIYDATVGDPDYDNVVPVSGTVTANAGTNLNTSSLALETGGNLASIATTNTTLAGTVSGGKVNVNLSSGALPTGSNTIGSVEITDGTNTANIQSIASGQNALTIGGGYKELNSLSAGSLNADLVASMDVSGYKSFSLFTSGTWSGTLTFQASNDNSNFYSIDTILVGDGTNISTSSGSSEGRYGFVAFRYLRVRMTSYSSGTVNGVLELYTQPAPPIVQGVAISNSPSVKSASATGSAVPSNAFYLGMQNTSSNLTGLSSAQNDGVSPLFYLGVLPALYNGSTADKSRSVGGANNTSGTGISASGAMGQYNSSAPTISNGNYNALQLDSSGNLKVNVTAGLAGSVEISDGTNTANILSSSGTAAGQNAQIVASQQPSLSTATWTTSTTVNTTLAQSCVGLGTATVTTVETGTTTTAGALTFEGYDGTNWWALNGQQTGSFTVQSTYTLVNATNVAWSFDVAGFQQFRVRLSTAITGTGSPQVVVILQTQAAANDITPTVGWAQKLDNVNDSITNYPFGHSYSHITTQTTTIVKSGAGVLHAIDYTATASGVITIYDNTAGSGTVIRVITSPSTILQNEVTKVLDVGFTTGLTIVTATANQDIVVSYR